MEKKIADNLLKSFIGAYVWVASADNGVDLQEFKKFGHVIVESPFATSFNEDHIRRYFKDTVALFESDYDRGISVIKAELKELAGQDHLCQEVMRIAKAAIVGDAKLKDVEESVLKEIARAMSFKE